MDWSSMKYPVTPDSRYFVVRGRLWRMTNPDLDEKTRTGLVKQLMKARRDVRTVKADSDQHAEAAAHRRRRGQAGTRRARSCLVERRRAGSEPAHGEKHPLRGLVRG